MLATPSAAATYAGQPHVLEYILKQGYMTTDLQESAIRRAIWAHNAPSVRLLLNWRIGDSSTDENQSRINELRYDWLEFAARYGSLDCFRTILAIGDVEKADLFEVTQTAMAGGHLELLLFLHSSQIFSETTRKKLV